MNKMILNHLRVKNKVILTIIPFIILFLIIYLINNYPINILPWPDKWAINTINALRLKKCPIHNIEMKRKMIEIQYGYYEKLSGDHDYLEAKKKSFVFADDSIIGGCIVERRKEVLNPICEECSKEADLFVNKQYIIEIDKYNKLNAILEVNESINKGDYSFYSFPCEKDTIPGITNWNKDMYDKYGTKFVPFLYLINYRHPRNYDILYKEWKKTVIYYMIEYNKYLLFKINK